MEKKNSKKDIKNTKTPYGVINIALRMMCIQLAIDHKNGRTIENIHSKMVKFAEDHKIKLDPLEALEWVEMFLTTVKKKGEEIKKGGKG